MSLIAAISFDPNAVPYEDDRKAMVALCDELRSRGVDRDLVETLAYNMGVCYARGFNRGRNALGARIVQPPPNANGKGPRR